jgi:hypothetical protein
MKTLSSRAAHDDLGGCGERKRSEILFLKRLPQLPLPRSRSKGIFGGQACT